MNNFILFVVATAVGFGPLLFVLFCVITGWIPAEYEDHGDIR
jgi:hypothetical protein